MARVTRDDIEHKLREIQQELDPTVEVAKPAGMTVGAAVAFGAIGIAYILGQRKSQQQATVIEVRRG